MAMRYGKIYYYDRMGNKIEDEVPYLKEDVDLTTLHRTSDPVNRNPFLNDTNEIKYNTNYDTYPLANTPSSKDYNHELPEELDQLVINEKKDYYDDNIDGLEKKTFKMNGNSLMGDDPVIFTPPDTTKEIINKFDKRLLNEKDFLDSDKGNNINISSKFHDEGIHYLEDGLCSECANHDTQIKNEEENKRLKRDLEDHIRNQNELLMSRKKNEILPMNVLPPFDREDDYDKKRNKYDDKLRYRRELEDEIEKKRMIALNELENEKYQNNKRNTIDAMMYAEEIKKREKKDNELKEYQDMVYQYQISKKKLPKEDAKEWWEKRSPFTDKEGKTLSKLVDDGSHLRRQLEKQKLLQVAGENLEIYKANMAKEDEFARNHQKEKYKEMRDDIAQQARLIREGDKKYLSKGFGNNDKMNDNEKWKQEVFDKWRIEHEKNDKKYKILQDCRKGDFGLFGARRGDMDGGRNKKYNHFDIRALEDELSKMNDSQKETSHTIHRCRRCHKVLKNF
uniref:Pre-mRNA-splicing factor SLU7 n=1 Tax=Strongyloides venezuelensis TaxID=75913 RepID=A0A0K0FGE2_STRVS